MASVVPVKEKKLMDVKLGELPSWILMRDFTPKGIAGAFQRGYYRYYNKYVNVKKGGVAGISMVLAAYVLFNYCRCYKELSECLSGRLALWGCSLLGGTGSLSGLQVPHSMAAEKLGGTYENVVQRMLF
ncbi:ATP synthase subunit f, mitochondrial isoform X1 [Neomonachus schauinslandi]|uniref:ATP synthase F(0) complex subunit f, mitochondrial n=1 Tax=Neomonachus schauinslandi TaxID=29088 RepID=A0A8M1MCS5_NEOSC|nr:ATP synthase subunit f, mitochondrial isoform X1 [Neomonachus schauinslandi]